MTDKLRGPTADTLAGDIVEILVPSDPPYGVNLIADVDGFAAVVASFDPLPNGRFGPIQKSGGVHHGDVLYEINDVSLINTKYEDVIKMVKDRNLLKKVFKFMNSKEYYRRKKGGSVRINVTDGKNNFLSTVKRSRIAEENSKKHVEYEVACQLRLAATKVQKEVVYQWSLWKRYSEFADLHQQLRRSLGWQMDGIEFPSAHTFVMNKLAPQFIEQRKDELKEYWQRVLSIDKVTDFTKHHCSQDLRAFVEVEQQVARQEIAPNADMTSTATTAAGSASSSSAAAASLGGGNSMRDSNLLLEDPTRASTSLQRRQSAKGLSAKRLSVSANAASSSSSSSGYIPTESGKAITSSVESGSARQSSPPPPPAPTAATAAASNGSNRSNNKPPPPPPPARPAAAAASLPPPPAPPSAAASVVSTAPPLPRPTGARVNLLGSINALRKD